MLKNVNPDDLTDPDGWKYEYRYENTELPAETSREDYVDLDDPERRAEGFAEEVNKSSDVTAERFGSAVYVSRDTSSVGRTVGSVVSALNTTYTIDRCVRKQQRAVYIFTEK